MSGEGSYSGRANSSAPMGGFVVTPNDGANLTGGMARVLKVGATAGDVKITGADGVDVVIPMAANSSFEILFTKVFATGTTATPVLAFR